MKESALQYLKSKFLGEAKTFEAYEKKLRDELKN